MAARSVQKNLMRKVILKLTSEFTPVKDLSPVTSQDVE